MESFYQGGYKHDTKNHPNHTRLQWSSHTGVRRGFLCVDIWPARRLLPPQPHQRQRKTRPQVPEWQVQAVPHPDGSLPPHRRVRRNPVGYPGHRDNLHQPVPASSDPDGGTRYPAGIHQSSDRSVLSRGCHPGAGCRISGTGTLVYLSIMSIVGSGLPLPFCQNVTNFCDKIDVHCCSILSTIAEAQRK